MSRILVVDDEANLRKVLAAILRKDGYEVAVAEDGEQALAEFEKNGADVIITDLVMPKLGGMDILMKVRAARTPVPVIIITAHGTVDSAVEAIKLGAFDYITKPFEHAEIRAVVAKAARTQEANQGHVAPDGSARKSIIGGGNHMEDLFKVIDKVADTPSTVLITGESGTGKELVATALHQGSSRRDKPLIKINCAAIPKDLMESELFGYERGAFTGAVSSKPGRFELADGGTLFLDEIGEVPIEMQVKLLRVLQESEFERVGGIKTTHVDVRLIAATNRDLEKEIEAGPLPQGPVLPPQRGAHRAAAAARPRRRHSPARGALHREVQQAAQQEDRGHLRRGPGAAAGLALARQHPRAREPDGARAPLRRRSAHRGEGSARRACAVACSRRPSYSSGAAPAPGETPLKDFLKQKQAEIEKSFIVQALAKTEGNVTRAAKLLQISRKSLQTKMKEFGLRDEEPAAED